MHKTPKPKEWGDNARLLSIRLGKPPNHLKTFVGWYNEETGETITKPLRELLTDFPPLPNGPIAHRIGVCRGCMKEIYLDVETEPCPKCGKIQEGR